jgi:uncharacterized membrane protein
MNAELKIIFIPSEDLQRSDMFTLQVYHYILIFERKIFGRIYGPKYENGKWKSRTNRELEEKRTKYSKMDKRAKDKLVRSPKENGGR